MTQPIRTLEDTLAWEESQLGISRHTPGCPWSGGANVDDCALFQAWALWGDHSVWNVNVFTTIAGGSYHAGSAGIQRGDVLLFGWTPGHFDHTEMATAAPSATTVATIGANGSDTIAVAHRTRNLANVTGYFRPAYPGSTAVQTATASIVSTTPQEDTSMEMYIAAPNGTVSHFIPGVKTDFATPAEYNDWKAVVDFTIQHQQTGTDLLSPPPVDQVVALSWDRWENVCKHFGVPTGRPADQDAWLAAKFAGMPA